MGYISEYTPQFFKLRLKMELDKYAFVLEQLNTKMKSGILSPEDLVDSLTASFDKFLGVAEIKKEEETKVAMEMEKEINETEIISFKAVEEKTIKIGKPRVISIVKEGR